LSSIDGEADFGSAETMIRHLMADHEALSRHLRATAEAADQAEDQVSADLLTDRLRAHEKAVWMLRAILA